MLHRNAYPEDSCFGRRKGRVSRAKSRVFRAEVVIHG